MPDRFTNPAPAGRRDNIDALRGNLLNDVLLSLALLSVPGLMVSLTRTSLAHSATVLAIQFSLVGLICGAWVFRRHLPYLAKLGIVLGALGIVGIVSYAQNGPAAVAGQFLLLFLVVAALFLQPPAAVRTSLVMLLLLLAVAIGAVAGVFPFRVDYAAYARDPGTWTLLLIANAGYGGAVAMIAARLLNEVLKYDDRLSLANEQLAQRTQEAEDASRLKGDILANLSHEFRTPMNGIIGMAGLLQITDDDPERQGYIAQLLASAHDLDGMLTRMMDYVQLGEPGQHLEESTFDLCELAAQSMRGIAPAAAAKGLATAFECDGALRSPVHAPGKRLQQVLGELLDNAVRFTAEGSVGLHLTLVPGAPGEEPQRVRIAVRDTGIGIPPELQHKVFEPFYQVDASRTRTAGGNGLGLAICQRIVRLAGGEFNLDSSPGTGSTFTVILPLRAGAME